MSKYTTLVRTICEQAAGYTEEQPFSKINSVIDDAIPHIFAGEITESGAVYDWPIFDEGYRVALEKKILRHYYMREIGLETAALWKFYLQTRLCEIMPYYNKLYQSETLNFNPLYDFSYTRQYTENKDGLLTVANTGKNTRTDNLSQSVSMENEGTRTDNLSTRNTGTIRDNNQAQGTNQNTNRHSDTPQGGITGLYDNRYLSDATIDDGSTSNTQNNLRTLDTTNANTGTVTTENSGSETRSNTGTQKNESENTENRVANDLTEYIETVSGKHGGTTYARMLMEYRDSMINIDQMIINELSDLFMTIY